jgi:transketolase
MATGSEVHLALKAQNLLTERGVQARVVAMPCWKRFEAQPESYQNHVLPPDLTARLAVEAAGSLGWHRYVGAKGAVMSIDHFGASAPYEDLVEAFGFTAEALVERALDVLEGVQLD